MNKKVDKFFDKALKLIRYGMWLRVMKNLFKLCVCKHPVCEAIMKSILLLRNAFSEALLLPW